MGKNELYCKSYINKENYIVAHDRSEIRIDHSKSYDFVYMAYDYLDTLDVDTLMNMTNEQAWDGYVKFVEACCKKYVINEYGERDKVLAKERLLKETIVLLSADLYQSIYDTYDGDSWGDTASEIIRLAEQFENELDWQEDDERDYIQELDKFERKVLDEISNRNEQ